MRVRVVGHRGASGYAPETTIAAYRLAIRMGVDFVEADVHMLHDGTLVAIHDADVRRTTNGKGFVGDFSLNELKGLDAGSWFNKAYPEKAREEYVGLQVPTLQEVIDLVKESRAGLLVEIKDPERYPPELESVLLCLIRTNHMEERTRFLSFSARSLRKIKDLDASLATTFLTSRPGKNPVQVTMEVPADELGIRFDHATPAFVDRAHRNGLSISVWTVDQPRDMQHMIDLGVDGITTNYPDRLIRLLRRN